MNKSYKIPYREANHGDFDAEWQPHAKVSGWWYITGYLHDDAERLYSYQYTLLRARIFGITATVLQLAFTDFAEEKHFFTQRFSLREKKFFPSADRISFPPLADLQKNDSGVSLNTDTEDVALNLNLGFGKGAFWHGDNGILVMGEPHDPVQRTLYYSLFSHLPQLIESVFLSLLKVRQ